MQDPLERKPLAVKMADLIEQSILKGEWTKLLPGHRVLMDHYGVSARTTLAAIDLLHQRGLISDAKQGSHRLILSHHNSKKHLPRNLLIILNKGFSSGEDMKEIEALRAAWEGHGGKVMFLRFDLTRYKRPLALLKKAVANHAAHALLLHIPPIQWTKAAASLKPTFIAGGQWRGVRITGIGYDLGLAITEWIKKLRLMGHERIFIPVGVPCREFADHVREKIAQEWGFHDDSTILDDFCPIIFERIPESWQKCWQRMFAVVRPTAVIVTNDLQYLSLTGYCSRMGIRIPADLSVVCLESTEYLNWCDPVPTRMKFPLDQSVSWFIKWMRNECEPIGMRFYPLEYVKGQTIAPPRQKWKRENQQSSIH